MITPCTKKGNKLHCGGKIIFFQVLFFFAFICINFYNNKRREKREARVSKSGTVTIFEKGVYHEMSVVCSGSQAFPNIWYTVFPRIGANRLCVKGKTMNISVSLGHKVMLTTT